MAAGSEEAVRQEAVRRVMAGDPVAAVARDLGRSEPWVRKWMRRYDPGDDDWAAERSRAPKVVANRADAEVEELIVKVRQRLTDNPWAQIGAAAIARELCKLGVEQAPPLRTIERVLARHEVPRRPRRSGGRHEPKGTRCPTPPCQAPNACQQADLVVAARCPLQPYRPCLFPTEMKESGFHDEGAVGHQRQHPCWPGQARTRA